MHGLLLCSSSAISQLGVEKKEKGRKEKKKVPFLILLVLGVLTESSPMPLYLQSCAE